MDADIFLQQFGHLAQGEDGIQKLRDVILQLAMRGKLVKQNPTDTSVVRNLEASRKELAKYADAKRRTSWKKSRDVSLDEANKEIPLSWCRARINDTGYYTNGAAFKPSDWKQSGIPIIRIQNLSGKNKEYNYADGDYPEEIIVEKNDLLVSWSATLDTFKWMGDRALLNQHIFKVSPCYKLVEHDFLFWLLKVAIHEMKHSDHAHGLVMKHINREPFLNHVVMIPPLAEQKRIVEKIDELMALCDKLETEQSAERALKTLAVQSTLYHLISTIDLSNFGSGLSILERTFCNCFDDLATVKQLRTTILQLAIQGNLIGDFEVRKTTNLSKNWRQCKLGELLSFGPKNGYSPKPVDYETETKSLTLSATTSGKFDASKTKFIDEIIPADSHLWLDKGDILIQRGNSSEYVGVSAIYNGKRGIFIYPDLMIKIRVTEDAVPEYIHLTLLAPATRAYFLKNASGTSGSMPKINQAVVKNTPISLPSLSEQKHIVAKVDELMALCDQLEAHITQTRTLNTYLMDSLIHRMTQAA